MFGLISKLAGDAYKQRRFWFPLGAISWYGTYIEAIRLGVKDKTNAFPLPVLTSFIVWEAIFSFHPTLKQRKYAKANAIWFAIDCILIYQAIKYSMKKYAEYYNISLKQAYCLLMIGFLFWYKVTVNITKEMDKRGEIPMIAMAILGEINHHHMLCYNKSLKGQSLLFQVLRLVGNAAFAIDQVHKYNPKYMKKKYPFGGITFWMFNFLVLGGIINVYLYLKIKNENDSNGVSDRDFNHGNT